MPSNIFANDRAAAHSDIDTIPGTEVLNSNETLDLDGSDAKSHV
jgi:hypothetical protein